MPKRSLPDAIRVAIPLLFLSHSLLAQTPPSGEVPDRQFGVGFDNRGAHLQYAVISMLHVGMRIGYYSQTDECGMDR